MISRRAQVALSVAVGTVVIFAGALFINTRELPLSSETLAALKPLPEDQGYPIANFKAAEKKDLEINQGPEPQISTYEDYQKNQTELDAVLKQNPATKKVLEEAIDVGQVGTPNSANLREHFALEFHRSQRIFLISVSQLIHAGKKQEALGLIEKANRFYQSFLLKPQVFVNKFLALNHLKQNLQYVIAFKKSDDKTVIQRSLWESFKITAQPQEIFASALKREINLFGNLILTATPKDFELTNINESSESKNISADQWLARFFYQKQQTLNWYVQISSELLTPVCFNSLTPDCSNTYKSQISDRGPSWFLINPFGRLLIQQSFQQSLQKKEKLTTTLQKLNEQLTAGNF